MRGPVVYTLDMIWNKELNKDKIDLSKEMRSNTDVLPTLIEKPGDHMLGPVYLADAFLEGKKVKVKLVPFANNGQWFREGSSKTDKSSKTFSYGIWLYK